MKIEKTRSSAIKGFCGRKDAFERGGGTFAVQKNNKENKSEVESAKRLWDVWH